MFQFEAERKAISLCMVLTLLDFQLVISVGQRNN